MTSTPSIPDAAVGRLRPTSATTPPSMAPISPIRKPDRPGPTTATPPAPDATRGKHPRGEESPATPRVPACRWVSAAYAGSYLGVSKMSIYRLIHSGQLPHTTVNGHFRVPFNALEAHANAHRGTEDNSAWHNRAVTPLRPRPVPRASTG
jgi:excisionase family DNA binding protein